MANNSITYSFASPNRVALVCIVLMLTGVYGLPAGAQPRDRDPVMFSFGTDRYELKQHTFYANTSRAIAKNEAAKRLMSSFNTESYQDYQEFFPAGECHVDQKTYDEWKLNIGDAQPHVLASFEIQLEDQAYCIIKYTLLNNDLMFSFGQLFKKLNDTWYFCKMDENIEKSDVIMFFSLVQEDFFDDFKKGQFSQQQRGCFLRGNHFDGSGLISAYFQKYRIQDPCFEPLNLLFEDRIQSVDDRSKGEHEQMEQLFRKTTLPAAEIDYLSRLVKSHHTHMALSHFSKISGLSMQEIYQQMSKVSTHE